MDMAALRMPLRVASCVQRSPAAGALLPHCTDRLKYKVVDIGTGHLEAAAPTSTFAGLSTLTPGMRSREIESQVMWLKRVGQRAVA